VRSRSATAAARRSWTTPDDDPSGGVDGLPLCGECERNRDEAADFEAMDMQDGELDGMIDW